MALIILIVLAVAFALAVDFAAFLVAWFFAWLGLVLAFAIIRWLWLRYVWDKV